MSFPRPPRGDDNGPLRDVKPPLDFLPCTEGAEPG